MLRGAGRAAGLGVQDRLLDGEATLLGTLLGVYVGPERLVGLHGDTPAIVVVGLDRREPVLLAERRRPVLRHDAPEHAELDLARPAGRRDERPPRRPPEHRHLAPHEEVDACVAPATERARVPILRADERATSASRSRREIGRPAI
jgi:hypothetical protein